MICAVKIKQKVHHVFEATAGAQRKSDLVVVGLSTSSTAADREGDRFAGIYVGCLEFGTLYQLKKPTLLTRPGDLQVPGERLALQLLKVGCNAFALGQRQLRIADSFFQT